MQPPTLDAYRLANGVNSALWCVHCRKWHLHGLPVGGHVVAHCLSSTSPYWNTGYIQRDCGDATADVEQAVKLRRPLL